MIGHASKDEYGKYAGGQAGDSTQKEVCTRKWYNAGWHTVLRPKSSTLAEKSAKACEAACANDKIGYDQKQRNTLNTQAKAVGYDLAKIVTPCECDCSALMHVCAIAGGAHLSYGSNGVTTSTMVNAFLKSGDYEKLTDSKYLTSDKYLKRGDVLVKTGHTVMNLTNGKYAGSETTTNSPEKAPSSSASTSQYKPNVKTWQLSAIADGFKFPKYGADGEWGAECVSVAKKAVVKKRLTYKYKNLTKLVQRIVGVEADGLCGSQTSEAIGKWQKANGLPVDKAWGINCWKKALGIK